MTDLWIQCCVLVYLIGFSFFKVKGTGKKAIAISAIKTAVAFELLFVLVLGDQEFQKNAQMHRKLAATSSYIK